MHYRKTQTRKGIDYYRIDLDGGWADPDIEQLPEHWIDSIRHLESEDKKTNKNYPDPFYSDPRKFGKMSLEGSRLVNGIYIVWDDDNGDYYITWSGKPLEQTA